MLNLVGQKFGRLTVLKRDGHDKSGTILWKCSCDCGNFKIVRGYSLRRGDTQSCGCLRKSPFNTGSSRKKYVSAEEATWRYYYNQYKRNANHRKIKIIISFDEFVSICSLPCYYCGQLPEERPCQRGRTIIKASGIDRIDNNKGYIHNNIVPCCTWCNRAKNSQTREYFITKCREVTSASVARNE
jgi:hypothetical protein